MSISLEGPFFYLCFRNEMTYEIFLLMLLLSPLNDCHARYTLYDIFSGRG